jgi:hypothetical protein
MLAHAFLVVVALAERTRHPAPPGLIGLTCNEVQHLFAALVAVPVADTGHRRAGRSVDADIKPAPAPATTNDRPALGSHEDHDPRLECDYPAGLRDLHGGWAACRRLRAEQATGRRRCALRWGVESLIAQASRW